MTIIVRVIFHLACIFHRVHIELTRSRHNIRMECDKTNLLIVKLIDVDGVFVRRILFCFLCCVRACLRNMLARVDRARRPACSVNQMKHNYPDDAKAELI